MDLGVLMPFRAFDDSDVKTIEQVEWPFKSES